MSKKSIYELLNHLVLVRNCEGLSSNAVVLYVYLLTVSNKLEWIACFKHTSSALAMGAGVDRKTLDRCRDELRERGLVDFRTVGRTKGAKQWVLIRGLGDWPRHLREDLWENLPENLQQKRANTSHNSSHKNGENMPRLIRTEQNRTDITQTNTAREKKTEPPAPPGQSPPSGQVAANLDEQIREVCAKSRYGPAIEAAFGTWVRILAAKGDVRGQAQMEAAMMSLDRLSDLEHAEGVCLVAAQNGYKSLRGDYFTKSIPSHGKPEKPSHNRNKQHSGATPEEDLESIQRAAERWRNR